MGRQKADCERQCNRRKTDRQAGRQAVRQGVKTVNYNEGGKPEKPARIEKKRTNKMQIEKPRWMPGIPKQVYDETDYIGN
ncbi:hypothetical protein RUM44_010419 [Polyplax serrata]|uniref:Uncharacterized protein n=1 Tax=Polyplax serrata TaxID=468196 RepID=A0ABR1AVG7_POLSC